MGNTYHDVQDLGLTFHWVKEFIVSNGIYRIPDFWAFVLETLGVASWIFVALIALSAFVGYAKQLSSHQFFYEHIIGHQFSSPFRWSFFYTLIWMGTHVAAFWITMFMVYFLKYGIGYALAVGFVGFLCLGLITFLSYLVMRKKPKHSPRQYYHLQQQQPPYYYYDPGTQLPPQQSYAQVGHAGYNVPAHINPQQSASYSQGNPSLPPTGQEQGFDPKVAEAMAILGLPEQFTKKDLEQRYKKLVKQVHADKGGSDALYLQVQGAYEYLLSKISQ